MWKSVIHAFFKHDGNNPEVSSTFATSGPSISFACKPGTSNVLLNIRLQ